MTSSIRGLLRLTPVLLSNNVNRQIFLNGNSRMLFTEATLGLPEYKNSRGVIQDRYKLSSDTFRDKMRASLNDEKSLIFTEDLKALLHIVEQNEDDISLLKNALEKFNNQDKDIRFGTFKFGPVVMRTFHYLNEPRIALETFKNPQFGSFYDQQTTFAILVDLLYENGMYAEVREVYDLIRTKFPNGMKNPKMVISILAMACYKENTRESLDFAIKVCKDMSDRGALLIRRVVATFTALALNQNAPHIALELLTICKKIDYVSTRTVRLLAFCDLDRIDDVVRDFEFSLKRGIPTRNQFFSDIVPRVEALIQRLNVEPNAEICELFELIKARNYIESKTLDEYLSEPLEVIKFSDQQKQHQQYTKYNGSGWSHQFRKRTDGWSSSEDAGSRSADQDSVRRHYD